MNSKPNYAGLIVARLDNPAEITLSDRVALVQWARLAESERVTLLAACKAQHDAIDTLFARLINLTCDHTPHSPFMPTKSGDLWKAAQAGFAAIKQAEGT